MKIELAKTEVIHFVGIGGIGIQTLKDLSILKQVFDIRFGSNIFESVFRYQRTLGKIRFHI